LLRKNLAGEVDDTAFAQVQAELVTARGEIAAEIAHLERELLQLDQQQVSFDRILQYCDKAGAELAILGAGDEASAFAAKQERIRDMVTAVWVLPDGSLRLEGTLPVIRNDGSGAVMTQEPGCIVIQTPACLIHNPSLDRPAGQRWSRTIAA
jgi:hypothetical protein